MRSPPISEQCWDCSRAIPKPATGAQRASSATSREDEPEKRVHLPSGNGGALPRSPKKVQLSSRYPMTERPPFTPKPNVLVGSLLFDAGNLAFNHDTPENALKLCQLAAGYSVPDPALLIRRNAHTKQLLERLAPKQPVKRAK